MKEVKFGFLRETEEDAIKAGIDKNTGIKRTGLEKYLEIIFPNVKDWEHDKPLYFWDENNKKHFYRPDYRSENLKMIIEFDGLPHYQNPDIILKDEEKNEIFKELGYKVIRIPYFIQLSNKVVKKLFNVDVKEKLFDENIPSLNIESRNTPAYLCPMGIRRMAIDFLDKSTEQLNVNIEYLQKICDEHKYKTLTVGLTYLIDEINYVTENL